MKKNDFLLVASAILFSSLFYMQRAGLNVLLFSMFYVSLLATFNTEAFRKPRNWYYAALVLVAGFAVFKVDAALPVLAFIFSAIILAAKTMYAGSSVVLGFIQAFFNLVAFPFNEFRKNLGRNAEDENSKPGKTIVFAAIGLGLGIAALFLVLYRGANPLFDTYVQQLDLDWMAGWTACAGGGFILVGSLAKYRDILGIFGWDAAQNKSIERNETFQLFSLKRDEIIVGTLFLVLNLMLLVMNILDLQNSFVGSNLPAGVTLSDFVHEAIASIIFSIVFAMALLAWFFRGQLNFSSNTRLVKSLVYLWIIQNLLMISTAMYRNMMYVDMYQLTAQRIGVYVFLILSVAGLLLTAIKIFSNKKGWFLVRANSEVWLASLCVLSLVGWGRLITNYNISHQQVGKQLDKAYLMSLGNSNLGILANYFSQPAVELTENERVLFYEKLLEWRSGSDLNWQELNLDRLSVNSDLLQLEKDGAFNAMTCSSDADLHQLLKFKNITRLHYIFSPQDMSLLLLMNNLKELEIGYLAYHFNTVPAIQSLEKLSLTAGAKVGSEVRKLKFCTRLRQLELADPDPSALKALNGHPTLKTLVVRNPGSLLRDFLGKNSFSFKIETK